MRPDARRFRYSVSSGFADSAIPASLLAGSAIRRGDILRVTLRLCAMRSHSLASSTAFGTGSLPYVVGPKKFVAGTAAAPSDLRRVYYIERPDKLEKLRVIGTVAEDIAQVAWFWPSRRPDFHFVGNGYALRECVLRQHYDPLNHV